MKGVKKMDAKTFLFRIEKIDMQIINKTIETNRLIEKLKDAAGSITSYNDGDRVQSSGNVDKMADAVIGYTDLQEELKRYIAEKTAEKNEIIKTIETLPTAEYDLLYKIYVLGYSLKAVSIHKSCSYSNITTLHGYALKHLQKVLDGKT